MKEIYGWVPWFQELAQKVATSERHFLTERTKKVDWNPDGKSPALLKHGDENIDPFSFFYYVAARNGTAASRTRIYRSISHEFGISNLNNLDRDEMFILAHRPRDGTTGRKLNHKRRPGVDLEDRFQQEMLRIYEETKEFGYYPTYFRRMVLEQGGLLAAKQLLVGSKLSDGFVRLWEEQRLDLAVEALAVREPWRALFTLKELAEARRRLDGVGFDFSE